MASEENEKIEAIIAHQDSINADVKHPSGSLEIEIRDLKATIKDMQERLDAKKLTIGQLSKSIEDIQAAITGSTQGDLLWPSIEYIGVIEGSSLANLEDCPEELRNIKGHCIDWPSEDVRNDSENLPIQGHLLKFISGLHNDGYNLQELVTAALADDASPACLYCHAIGAECVKPHSDYGGAAVACKRCSQDGKPCICQVHGEIKVLALAPGLRRFALHNYDFFWVDWVPVKEDIV